ncbi:NAD(P)H-quinone oxidoreductase subunit N, chloroplastic [Neltuma alba]|uniref:NAD(P)H-quinone oxidoreductase subunit N, chloroplastic n=1 Tax=Neltuma alba TaxID=207710 RepID=UPI0010A45508|nr:NAD(P)H-quinone oxidoreductase subunit N, chloroplastic-like [Prosopis alba]
MSASASLLGYGGATSLNPKKLQFVQQQQKYNVGVGKTKTAKTSGGVVIRCSSNSDGGGIGIGDFIGGDLLRLDLGKWLSDVEEHKALAIYSPHEGGYEGRYFTRLRYQGYYFLDLSARGLGDPEATLTKIHPVCPAHVGKQPIARWYFPPEVDYRLKALPPDAKGLVVWIIEAKVLSKAELQFLALLPTLRPKVRVIAECGNWRKFMWRPLKEIAGLTSEAA